MAEQSTIEWTRDQATGRPGATWQVVTGCSKADGSCENCYAMQLSATRLRHLPEYEGVADLRDGRARWTGKIVTHAHKLEEPLEWTRRQIFVCSMSDLFHADVPDAFIARVWAAMILGNARRGHLFFVLTKRAERLELLSSGEFATNVEAAVDEMLERQPWGMWVSDHFLPADGVHVGVSAGDHKRAKERWPHLARANVQARFLSLEPLVGNVDLGDLVDGGVLPDRVLVGGESSSFERSRPCHPRWAYDLEHACRMRGIPFHFKQWGSWAPVYHGNARRSAYVTQSGERFEFRVPGSVLMSWHRSKKKAGRVLAGSTHDGEVRACPSCWAPYSGEDRRCRCPLSPPELPQPKEKNP